MFKSADTSDFQRMLSDILEKAQLEVGRAAVSVESTFAKANAIGNSRLSLTIEEAVTPLHERALEDIMKLIIQFVEKTNAQIEELITLSSPQISMLNEYCVERISRLVSPGQKAQVANSARARFRQRADHAERDLRVGFISGKAAVVNEPPSSQGRALRLLKTIYDTTRDTEQPVFVTQLQESTSLSESEAQAAWRYLRDRGLIQTYSIPYTARINAAGIDAIETARRRPDSATPSFPAMTYNVVNNTVHIGTAINSPLQQGGPGATQHQSVTYNQQQLNELSNVLGELRDHLDELRLDQNQKRNALAQIATLEAQIGAEPNHTILYQAGRSLRSITEGAIASLLATAAQPTVWVAVADIMSRLFS